MKSQMLHREIVFCSAPIKGSFSFNEIFNLFSDDSLPTHTSFDADHPLVLEYKYEIPADLYERFKRREITPEDHIYIDDFRVLQLNKILNLLTVFTSHLIFSYNKIGKNQDKGWFVTENNLEKSEWGFKIYSYPPKSNGLPTLSTTLIASIPSIPREEYGKISFYNREQFPDDLKDLFEIYYKTNNKVQLAFENAARLFKQGFELVNISLSLSYMCFIMAIESLIHYEYKDVERIICEACELENFRVVHKFQEFISKYGELGDKYKKDANEFYGLRSQIAHRGDLLNIDTDPEFTNKMIKQKDLVFRFKDVAEICMRNWLISKI